MAPRQVSQFSAPHLMTVSKYLLLSNEVEDLPLESKLSIVDIDFTGNWRSRYRDNAIALLDKDQYTKKGTY